MPSRKNDRSFRCVCILCIDSAGYNSDGAPVGCLIAESKRYPHLARARAEQARRDEHSAGREIEHDIQIPGHVVADEISTLNTQGNSLPRQGGDNQVSTHFSSLPPSKSNDAAAANDATHGKPVVIPIVSTQTSTPLGNAQLPVNDHEGHTINQEGKREYGKRAKRAHLILARVQERVKELIRQLSTNHVSVASVQQLEKEVELVQRKFNDVSYKVGSIDKRKKEVKALLIQLQEEFARVRKELPEQPKSPIDYESGHYFNPPINRYDQVTQIAFLILVVCNAILGVSRRLGDLMLGFVFILLNAAFSTSHGSDDLADHQKSILDQIPKTIETVLKRFSLEGKTVTYAVCPACHCTYAPTYGPGITAPSYPLLCNNNPSPGVLCGEELVGAADEHGRREPRKKFLHHSFHDFLAMLLARRDLESVMDRACDDLYSSVQRAEPIPECVTDIFQGEFIRGFKGPDDKLFIARAGNEGRYLFAFNVDFFHTEGQTIRGAQTSCGLISAVCLNLPLDLRYKPENMYVAGVIPDHPSMTELNHYMRLVVDDFLESWEKGVKYSRTANYPEGRLTRCAIVASVNDLPAARHVSQAANQNSHHICTRCNCYHKNRCGRVDISSDDWQPKDRERLRKQAEAWKNAKTVEAQDAMFKENGLRWSELWRLPYWDPTCMLVIDSMHCLLEGLAQAHFRVVLGLTESNAKTKDIPLAFQYTFALPDETYAAEHFKAKDDARNVPAIHRLLTAPLGKEGEDKEPYFLELQDCLSKRTLGALRFVMESVGATPEKKRNEVPGLQPTHVDKSPAYSKAACAKALTNWRRNKPLRGDDHTVKFGTLEVLSRIRHVIRDMETPSWLPSVPSKFGSVSEGSLKADEWRTMSTVYLPIALVSLWGEGTAHPSPEDASSFRKALDHTMDLVMAISLACRRTMTEARMTAYQKCICSWVGQLKTVHPKANPTVNAHMAIHIYDFLRLFGPVRSWWCFPFERLIGQLQRLPSNHKTGELEATTVSSFLKASNLRHWLARPDCPRYIKECEAVFSKAFAPQNEYEEISVKGHALVAVPPELKHLLNDRKIALRARHKFDKVMFSRRQTHVGNSLILFNPAGDRMLSPIPGSIEYIVAKEDGSIVYAVRYQRPAHPDAVDPFRHYPYFDAKIYSPEFSSALELVQPEWVLSHYGLWKLDSERAVVLNLSRD